MLINFKLNGDAVRVDVAGHVTLLELLREEFELLGAKEGCGYGECGSCTVLVDGQAVNSCLMLAAGVNGKEVETIEGLGGPQGELDPLQQAFLQHGAVQCGFCTPGMIMSARALLKENPYPTEEEIRRAWRVTCAAVPAMPKLSRPLRPSAIFRGRKSK